MGQLCNLQKMSIIRFTHNLFNNSLHIATSFIDAAQMLSIVDAKIVYLLQHLPGFVDIILHCYVLFCVRKEHAKHTNLPP
jgi:hypothetical protein